VRLIRSKGVGVYFVTQNPLDVPDKVLGQLGNRIQHALRAFTPRDQKAVRSAAETMRDNPDLDEKTVITELGVGEALVSLLDEKGRPHIVERAFILPPQSKIGPIDAAQRKRLIGESPIAGHYEKVVDQESAYEMLKARAARELPPETATETRSTPGSAAGGIFDTLGSILGTSQRHTGKQRESAMEAFAKSAARSIGSELGRQLLRGVLGSLTGRKR
jgi:hypothetical protein